MVAIIIIIIPSSLITIIIIITTNKQYALTKNSQSFHHISPYNKDIYDLYYRVVLEMVYYILYFS